MRWRCDLPDQNSVYVDTAVRGFGPPMIVFSSLFSKEIEEANESFLKANEKIMTLMRLFGRVDMRVK